LKLFIQATLRSSAFSTRHHILSPASQIGVKQLSSSNDVILNKPSNNVAKDGVNFVLDDLVQQELDVSTQDLKSIVGGYKHSPHSLRKSPSKIPDHAVEIEWNGSKRKTTICVSEEIDEFVWRNVAGNSRDVVRNIVSPIASPSSGNIVRNVILPVASPTRGNTPGKAILPITIGNTRDIVRNVISPIASPSSGNITRNIILPSTSPTVGDAVGNVIPPVAIPTIGTIVLTIVINRLKISVLLILGHRQQCTLIVVFLAEFAIQIENATEVSEKRTIVDESKEVIIYSVENLKVVQEKVDASNSNECAKVSEKVGVQWVTDDLGNRSEIRTFKSRIL